MNARILLIAALATAFAGPAALACGDSLYRVGKGTPYRTYTTPLPGNLLVMATSEESRHVAQMLADSGHAVVLVAHADDLAEALQHGGHDIVIAPFEYRDAVAASGNTTTAYLPVVTDRKQKNDATQAYGAALSGDDNIKRYLKTVHKTLVSRA